MNDYFLLTRSVHKFNLTRNWCRTTIRVNANFQAQNIYQKIRSLDYKQGHEDSFYCTEKKIF